MNINTRSSVYRSKKRSIIADLDNNSIINCLWPTDGRHIHTDNKRNKTRKTKRSIFRNKNSRRTRENIIYKESQEQSHPNISVGAGFGYILFRF